MRKFISLFAAIFIAASMMAESYTITFKDGGTDSDKTASLTSTTVADYVDAGAEYVSAIAPEGKVYYAKVGAGLKFGNSSGGGKVTLTLATPIKPTSIVVSASQFGASEGSGQFQDQTFDMTAGGGKYSFNDYTVTYDGNTEVTTIAVGTAKRGYVKSITVNYVAEQGGQGGGEESNTMTVYCQMTQSWWTADGAAVAVHYWGGEADATAWPGVRMNAVAGQEGLWSYDVPADVEGLMFVRVNGSGDIADWGAKTANLTLPTDGKNLFTITNETETWGDPGCAGVWSVYGEEPAEPILANGFYLVGTMNNWTPEAANLFVATEANPAEYKLTVTLTENDEIKVVKVENDAIIAWYPAEGGNYVVDAAHAGADKDIYFQEEYKEDWAAFGGYFWTGAAVVPVADFTNPFTLKFNGTGESGKDATAAFTADVAAIFDAASAPYVASVETATKIYAGRPISDDNSSVKFGTSSAQGTLAFTLAQAIEVDSIIVNATQYGNNAAKVTVNGTEFDLTAGNKVPQDCKITPEGAVSVITIAQSGTERIYLRYVKVYPHVEGGQEEPATLTVAVTGDMTQWAEDIPFVLADDSLSATLYNDNIKAGTYEFKMKINGEWRSNGYTYHRGFTGAAGISGDNTNNMVFTADVEGAYTFTWTFANDSLGIEFPEAPVVVPAKYYITGDSALVGAELQWHPDALKAEQDTMELNLAAGDYTLKVTVDGTWETAKGYDNLTVKADGLSTDKDNNIHFTLAEAGTVKVIYTNELFKLEGNFYVAPVAKFWIAGGEDIVGEGHGTWTKESALVSYSDTLTMSLAAGSHEFKLITENDEWWGIEHLTDTAVGIYTNEYTNVCFKLAEAGEVKVIYKAGEVFKVEGNFYVAPQAKYYVIGDSALVVNAGLTADKAWTPDAIVALNDTLVLNLAAGDYTMRLSLYGGWDNNKGYESLTDTTAGLREHVDEYNNHNIIFTLAEAGAVTIIYNANEFKILGNFYVAPAPDPTAAVIGSMTEWQQAIPFVLADDKLSATFADTIPAGSYEVKMIINGEWRSNGGTIDREHPTAIVADNVEANMTFVADTKGLYTFTWFFANDSFCVVYPEYVEPEPLDTTWYLVGDMTDWETSKISFENGPIVANLTDEGRTYGFKVLQVIGDEQFWYGNAGTMTRENHENWVFETTIQANGMLIADVAGEYTFAMTINEAGNPVVTVTYPEAPAPVLTNGYYLVGSLNEWTPAAEYLFVANQEVEGEYSLDVTLTEADEIKVVYVENDAIVTWFPAEGSNYIVDFNHSGATTIYFRPAGNAEWSPFGGYMYVVPTSTVGVENVQTTMTAEKVLREGQVVIIRGEHTYTPMGQMIK